MSDLSASLRVAEIIRAYAAQLELLDKATAEYARAVADRIEREARARAENRDNTRGQGQ